MNSKNSNSLVKIQNILSWLVIALASLWGIYQSISLSWVGDDAFISFRYAKNLINGQGLVYNIGERVEGYTNFLWTIIIALGLKLGLDPVIFSEVLGIISYLITIAIFIYLSKKLFFSNEQSKEEIFVPLTALALLFHHDYHIYATSGLETSWFTMLVSLGLAVLLFAKKNRSFFLAGLILVLAAASRPDGLLLGFVSIFYLFLTEKGDWRKYLAFILPFILLYLPYWIIRYRYYGYPFPNTYYAKSANLTYYDQGVHYFKLYFFTYYVLLLTPIFGLWLLFPLLKTYWEAGFRLAEEYKAVVLSALFAAPYIFYVVRVGGDFMFARFFIPVTPLCFFLLEAASRAIIKNNRWRLIFVFLIILGTFFRYDQYRDRDAINGVAYEPRWYPKERIVWSKKVGENLKKYLDAPDIKVVFSGTQAMLVYYADVPTAIEGAAGLTDEYVAHLPMKNRGRPGHEKQAPRNYLIRKRVNFDLAAHHNVRKKISFAGFEAEILVYDNKVMRRLQKYKEVVFFDFPASLDYYIRKIDSLSDKQVEKDYREFAEYYFAHNNDEKREAYFIKRLTSKSSAASKT